MQTTEHRAEHPVTPDPLARRRALYAARAILEAYALTRGYDPGISLSLDALYAAEENGMNEHLDAALTPEAFNYPSCSLCGQPVHGATLTWMLRPPGPGEADPPRRYVWHDECERKWALIDRGDDPHGA